MKYLAVDEILLNLVADCRSTCHPDCKDNLPLPCIPLAPGTPGGNKLVGVSVGIRCSHQVIINTLMTGERVGGVKILKCMVQKGN